MPIEILPLSLLLGFLQSLNYILLKIIKGSERMRVIGYLKIGI